MSSGWIIFFEISLVLGLALIFGIREIRSMRKFSREREERARAETAKDGKV